MEARGRHPARRRSLEYPTTLGVLPTSPVTGRLQTSYLLDEGQPGVSNRGSGDRKESWVGVEESPSVPDPTGGVQDHPAPTGASDDRGLPSSPYEERVGDTFDVCEGPRT